MEFIKPLLQQSSVTDESMEGYDLDHTLLKKDLRDTAAWAILQFVRVLYPIAPFIAKKLSGEIGIIDMQWPDISNIDIDFSSSITKVELLKDIISSVRSMRKCLRIAYSEKLDLLLDTDEDVKEFVFEHNEILSRMANVNLVNGLSGKSISIVVDNATLKIAIPDSVDIKNERQKLIMECEKLIKSRNDSLAKLSNEDFLNKAPKEVVEEHKQRVDSISEKVSKMELVINGLSNI